MKSNIPERFIWAATILNVQANEHVLEIGCGTGLLASQICAPLSTGKYTGIEKSASMLEKAKKSNSLFIGNGKASFIHSDFGKANLPAYHFDKILAFNVPFFWKNSTAELKLIHKVLKPTGLLYVFYQAPFEIDIRAAEPIKQKLKENLFIISATKFKKLAPFSAFCIMAGKGVL